MNHGEIVSFIWGVPLEYAGAHEGPERRRVAIIMNGSPLFTGDAGSDDTEIRRFILDNDLVVALIALPDSSTTPASPPTSGRHEPEGARTAR
jgi:hypothetical protein